MEAETIREDKEMKVLLLNGSPRREGNTCLALHEMEKIFHEEGIETELVHVGALPIRGCIACGGCAKSGKCAIDDIVHELAGKFEESDGLVVGSPVYYASANATLIAGEGMQMMRTLARNMAFLMKSIALGKEKYGLPQKEPKTVTNFVR